MHCLLASPILHKASFFLHHMSKPQSSLRPMIIHTARPPPGPTSRLLSLALGLPLAAGLCAVPLSLEERQCATDHSCLVCWRCLFALATVLPIPARADDSSKVTIRCDKNKTITDALAQHQGGP